MRLQIVEEKVATTDLGSEYTVWDVYRDERLVATCYRPEDARDVYEGLLCWASMRAEASEKGGTA